MLSESELETLLLDIESDRVERKSGLGDRDKIRQAICAFSNDLPDHKLPGVVFVGVNDDGSCANFPITDQVLLTLGDMRSNGDILPFPMMSVQKKTLHGCEIAIIEVQPAYAPPVRYNGRVWIRVGPRRATATADEERRLTEKRRAGDLPFDRQPAYGTTLDDLDLTLFQRVYLPTAVSPEVLAENQRTVEQQLVSLHFLTKEALPNHAAILTLGKEPRSWIPGAYIQFLRIEGMDLTDPIRDQKELAGALSDLLHQLDELLEANISTPSNIQGGSIEIRQPDYPLIALQQLARNAILHRTYEATNAPTRIHWFSDRIEILSPGGPFGQVNKSNFAKPGITDYRNPLLAEAMKVLGFVQRFGMGIPLAQKELEKNGNPPPEFQVEPSGILAVVRRKA